MGSSHCVGMLSTVGAAWCSWAPALCSLHTKPMPMGTPGTEMCQLMDGNSLCSQWYHRRTARLRETCIFETEKAQRIILQLKMKQ